MHAHTGIQRDSVLCREREIPALKSLQRDKDRDDKEGKEIRLFLSFFAAKKAIMEYKWDTFSPPKRCCCLFSHAYSTPSHFYSVTEKHKSVSFFLPLYALFSLSASQIQQCRSCTHKSGMSQGETSSGINVKVKEIELQRGGEIAFQGWHH